MLTSLILAKLFGFYFIIIGTALVLNQAWYQKAIHEMAKSNGQTMIVGIITLILGLMAVTLHNVWVYNWEVWITLLCWMMLIKGVVRTVFPSYFQQLMNKIRLTTHLINTISIICITVGLLLLYQAFRL